MASWSAGAPSGRSHNSTDSSRTLASHLFDSYGTHTGYLAGVRGRSGGLRLAKPADKINLGSVVRITEPDFALVECFSTGNQCVLTKCCKLQGVLDEALQALLAVLDRHTLASIALGPSDFRTVLQRDERLR